MKKFSSVMMIAMMMIAAIGLTACGSDDDDNDGNDGGGKGSQQTLTIDGKSYYCGTLCSAEQTKSNGMYLTVTAVENKEFETSGYTLTAYISPNTVAELNVGDSFTTGDMSIQMFRSITSMSVGTYMWNVVEGNITITKITAMEMTIQINGLKLKHKNSGVEHTISGTAVLNSGVYSSDNKLLSFADAIK